MNQIKSQVCTNKEQSERLLKLGLKKETSDMTLRFYEGYHDPSCCACEEDDIPAWSFNRLWALYWSNKVDTDCLFGCGKYMSPYAKIVAMIEYDIEDGTFNKEYLSK